MSMERLTLKRDWIEAGKDLSHEYGYSHIWRRLKQIEDILGDTYDLDRLRELVEADNGGAGKPPSALQRWRGRVYRRAGGGDNRA